MPKIKKTPEGIACENLRNDILCRKVILGMTQKDISDLLGWASPQPLRDRLCGAVPWTVSELWVLQRKKLLSPEAAQAYVVAPRY